MSAARDGPKIPNWTRQQSACSFNYLADLVTNQLDKQTELSPEFNNKYENRRHATVRAQGAPAFGYESCSLLKHWFQSQGERTNSPVEDGRELLEIAIRGQHISLRYCYGGWAGVVEDVPITQIVT